MIFDRLQVQILLGNHIVPLLALGDPKNKFVHIHFANIPFELKWIYIYIYRLLFVTVIFLTKHRNYNIDQSREESKERNNIPAWMNLADISNLHDFRKASYILEMFLKWAQKIWITIPMHCVLSSISISNPILQKHSREPIVLLHSWLQSFGCEHSSISRICA